MDIPDHLVSQVRDGNAIIFLGAGASRGAQTETGTTCPTTQVLTTQLSAKFLRGKFDSYPLNQVAEYAISESDLVTVQTFIRSLFAD
jgi:hypothetical protein